jgi:hypothetical protein
LNAYVRSASAQLRDRSIESRHRSSMFSGDHCDCSYNDVPKRALHSARETDDPDGNGASIEVDGRERYWASSA